MPALIKIGRRTIITAEADQEWRQRMEKAAAGVQSNPKIGARK
jgi:hypothetical protein